MFQKPVVSPAFDSIVAASNRRHWD